MGKGALYLASSKQKVMASRSIEAELVAVADTMPKILWYRYFLEAHGCTVEDVYVYQYNQIVILLEKNGMNKVGKGTRHVKIKYFFVTNKVMNNELKVIYCPTKKMIGDFFTKSLQGALFIEHRNAILGIKEDDFQLYMKQYKDFMQGIIID